uniref:Uncharacterized protein n=1 Tax=Romanomermis culicivorax TaxID=13658 RepID=A0A915JIJ4_ROMCU
MLTIVATPNIIRDPIVTTRDTILTSILPAVMTTLTSTTATMAVMIIKATGIRPQTTITAIAIDSSPFFIQMLVNMGFQNSQIFYKDAATNAQEGYNIIKFDNDHLKVLYRFHAELVNLNLEVLMAHVLQNPDDDDEEANICRYRMDTLGYGLQ